MKIRIEYALCTDDDYILRNPEKFNGVRVINKGLEENIDYKGAITFHNDDIGLCKEDAKYFLWELLCEGISVGATHYWLLEDFYKMMEFLTNMIDQARVGWNFTKYMSGNYDGTEVKVMVMEQ